MRDFDSLDFYLDGDSAFHNGIVLQSHIVFSEPKPRVETIPIAGRNGDLHRYDGSYDNITGEAECYVAGLGVHSGKVSDMVARTNAWLLNKAGYRRLETSYEPYIYRMARVVAGAVLDARLNRVAPFSLLFDCKPQKYLLDGEQVTPIRVSGNKIYNPTIFESKPLLRVYGNGNGTITIGEHVVSLQSISEYVDIDCELMDAYKGTSSKNRYMVGDFPTIAGGAVVVSWSGGVTGIDITPRWWML